MHPCPQEAERAIDGPPFTFMQGMTVRIGRTETATMASIDDEMAGRLLSNGSRHSRQVWQVREIGRKGERAGTPENLVYQGIRRHLLADLTAPEHHKF